MTDPEPRYVGGYALRERVGASASGETFRARDAAFGREVAVKVLSPRLAGDPETVRALEAKSRAAMRLDHPNIASLLDVGSDEGIYFVVTEFVHGRSLDRIVQQEGPLSVNQAVETAAEVAAALHAGHSLHLVHGSLRLTKIMHTLWGETRLTGFGVVPRRTQSEDATRTQRPDDASDEPASDIFALGAVLSELLTGEPPPVAPGERALQPSNRNSDIPPELDAIVTGALAPQGTAEAFGNALELEAALRSFRGGHLERLVWGEETGPQVPLVKPDDSPPSPPAKLRRGDSPRAKVPRWRRTVADSGSPQRRELEEDALWTEAPEHPLPDGPDVSGLAPEPSAGTTASVAPAEVDLGDVDPFRSEAHDGEEPGVPGAAAASEIDLGEGDADPFRSEENGDPSEAPGPPGASAIDLGDGDENPFGSEKDPAQGERPTSPAMSDVDLGDVRADPFEEEGRTATEVLDRGTGNGAVEEAVVAPPRSSPAPERQQFIDLDDAASAALPDEVERDGRDSRAPQRVGTKEHRRGATGRWVRRALVTVCVLAAADLAYTGTTVVSSLREAGDGVRGGISQLRSAQYDRAENAFSRAADASERAVGAMGHPSYRFTTLLPWLGQDARALRGLAEGSRLSAVAGKTATDAIVAMGAPKGGPAAAIYREGKIQFDALEIGTPLVKRVHDVLEDASDIMAGAPEAHLWPIRDAVSVATGQVEGARTMAAKVETLTDALPSLFGRGAARRYLLVFQSPSKSRGSGGVVAFYGILETENGRINVGNVRPVNFLGDVSAAGDAAPGWFADEYARFGALEGFSRANFSPGFSVVAPVLTDLYESAVGVKVDGVVGMDPTALGRLSKVTGPIRQPGYGVKLDATNTAEVLNHDVYLHFAGQPQARDAYIASVIEEFWRRVSSPSARVSALPSSLPASISSQHFKVYSRLSDDQRALVDLEANGDYRAQGTAVQTVFHNNLTDNKIDYFFERRVDTAIRLGTNGRASVTTEAVLENNAVPGPSSDFLGPGNNPSTNRMRLSFLLPQQARVRGYDHTEGKAKYEAGKEGAYPLVSENIRVAAGNTVGATVHYTMRIPRLDEDGGKVRFTMFPQATANPDGLALEITAPDGFSIATPDGPGALEADGSFSFAGSAEAPVAVELQILPD
jgi:serine/threonine protein kinase